MSSDAPRGQVVARATRGKTVLRAGACLLLAALVLTLATLVAARVYGFVVVASQPWWLEHLSGEGGTLRLQVAQRDAPNAGLFTALLAALGAWVLTAMACLRLLVTRQTWIAALTLSMSGGRP